MSLPPDVASVLRTAGWSPGRRDLARARSWALLLASHASAAGVQHTVVPGAIDVFAEYGGLQVSLDGAGEQVALSSFTLDPLRGLHSASTLAELAALIEADLTPIGEEGDGTGLIALDARGRVFLIDHTADWHLGDTLDEALTVLVQGLQPRRVREDGTWN